MKFSEYRILPQIKQNLEAMRLIRPTDIQFKSITPILQGEDLLAIAQTGTGKTAAFAIPAIHLMSAPRKKHQGDGPRCLVLEPTRELAIQVGQVFESIAKKTKVKILPLIGGVEQDPQIARLSKGVDILIATPGRMFDLASQGHLDLSGIELFILDEADHMLDLGFLHDISDLHRRLPKNRQTLFFSATISPRIKKIAYDLVRGTAIRIQISPKNPVAKNVSHAVTTVEMDHKRFFLARLVEENSDIKILVFVRTKVRAERVCEALKRVGLDSVVIHGDKAQSERLSAMEAFRSGENRVLIATDVSARGIDIPAVDYVVNYDLPDVPENYVHRVGRTGRGDRKGKALSFCAPEEKPLLEAIETFLGQAIEMIPIGRFEYEETLNLHDDRPNKWKAIEDEIEKAEQFKKKK